MKFFNEHISFGVEKCQIIFTFISSKLVGYLLNIM